MNNSKNGFALAAALVALIIAIGSCFVHVTSEGSVSFGASTPGTRFPHGITVGLPPNIPSNYALIESGTCFLLADFSITATTTRNVDCAITDAVAGDRIQLTLAASTTLASQYIVKSSQASSTSGFATAQLVNLTGGNAVPSATNGFGSTTEYRLFRTQ